MAENSSSDKVLGVDKKVIEAFLELIRDKYSTVDEANYFLESRTGASGVNIAIVNQRDFTSHLATVLKNPGLPNEKHYDQLSAAEEHLRRAIIECYQRSLNIKLIGIQELLPQYKRIVLRGRDKNPKFKDAPAFTQIRDTLRTIQGYQTKGRKAKSRNNWDKEWEDGVKAFMDAFELAVNLEESMEIYISTKETTNNPWKIAAIGLFALCLILAIAIVFK